MAKPIGKIKATEMQMRRPANDKAVFVNVLCQDESGARYYFTAAAFGFDLKPGYPPEISGTGLETSEAMNYIPTHWSKDPLVPYIGCRCATCNSVSTVLTTTTDSTIPNRGESNDE
jgi:hypothetical protein